MINKEEIRRQIKTIKAHSVNEYRETIHLLRLLKKRAKSQEEKAFIRHQSIDIIKISIVIVIGALPGGTVAVTFMELGFRKFNRTILPTSYSDEMKEELEKMVKDDERAS